MITRCLLIVACCGASHEGQSADQVPRTDPSDHWAFQAIVRPAVPAGGNKGWERNPVDAFLAQQHQQLGLSPQTEAPRRILLRRLYLDLVGVPPTAAELTALEHTQSPGWYE